ncbi:MAG: hypothetical protein EOP82_21685 [Variovorax sp.]|nr:MAG: hypothetical protein EOP82_21685 [Variovorax sp.]
MAVLLRDDFTGSGTLSGRTPDGVHTGTWTTASWYSDDAANATISGGNCGRTTSGSWGANITLPGSPADAYIEAGCLVSSGNSVGLGIRNQGTLGRFGVFAEFAYQSGTQVLVNTSYDGTNLSAETPGTSAIITATPSNFVGRIEVQGTTARFYVNSTLVITATIDTPATGGAAYIDAQFSTGKLSYVEAGDMALPVIPPFWTAFRDSREVV